jgi:hypothetical protein
MRTLRCGAAAGGKQQVSADVCASERGEGGAEGDEGCDRDERGTRQACGREA